ncbi:MAG: multidrug efflux pump [Vicingaceae bacterium]|jgi:multidrug efflux pump
MSKNKKSVEKEFGLSSWAINNPTVIYVMMAIFFFLGLSSYFNLPRENFPEIKETKIYISTGYPGNTAEDIERLIVDPLEEELNNVSNVKEILSTSQEDYGIITIEFDEDISVEEAKVKVKDKVDGVTSGSDWPTFNGAKVEPNVFDLNLSEEIAIVNYNITGDYPVEKLKEFAEYLEDEIETISEIKQVDIRGAQEKEVEVAVDVYKMMAAKVSFQDISNAISSGNVTMSAGNLINSGQRRTIRILGEIQDPVDLENFVVKSEKGSAIYLKDIAEVKFKDKEKTTFAREWGNQVVMLDVKKRAGKNMVDAIEQANIIVQDARDNFLPPDVTVTSANDQSELTINQVDDLVNNIIFGIILVVTVLMFFLGFKNALFVGFAIPMSMVISFFIIELLGYTMNTMILFAMIMGLGMLVDNGIVVVENVYRLMSQGMTRTEAAKKGIGEIAVPIMVSTLTTVAAFVPLGLWPGIMGQFMKYFPITLSIVLGSSLFVAYFFNSMLVSKFMTVEDKDTPRKLLIRNTIILVVLGTFILIVGGAYRGLGSVMIFTAFMMWMYRYFIKGWSEKFQNKTLVGFENWYEGFLRMALKKRNAYYFLFGTFIMLIVSLFLFGGSLESGRTKVEFFPDNQPKQIITYIEYPEGTAIDRTNKITKDIEKRINAVLNDDMYLDETGHNFLVESSISVVGSGAGNPQTDGGSSADMPHRGKVTASMREFKFRNGASSEGLRLKVQESLKGIYPGVSISVEKDAAGPPTGYPVNIEISGKDYAQLIDAAGQMRDFINAQNVIGIDELKIDVNRSKPSIEVNVDRKKAGELGVSASQVGNQLRNSIFGSKAGVYKEDGEDYDIYVRFDEDIRYNTNALFNQNMIFRDPASGQIKEIPVSAVATQKNTSGYSAIKHIDLERVVLVYSGVVPGANPAEIVGILKEKLKDFEMPKGTEFDFTGEMEEQEAQMMFLMGALVTGLFLIFLILIFQFSSVIKPTIIMVAIFLSFIGVFLGLVITGWNFVIMMTMMGIISLAGIVVNNGVVLLDYTDLLMQKRKYELGLAKEQLLSREDTMEAIVIGGKARLRPVILTAITTVLGLIPLAIGFNIDFFSLFSQFDPKIFIGGDNVIFWGPLAWTVIFGLSFATFLTLVIVPVMNYLVYRIQLRFAK